MKTRSRLLLAAAGLALAAGPAMAETVIIGMFGNPTPMQAARAEKKFEAATGWDIEWRVFGAGTEVIAASALLAAVRAARRARSAVKSSTT